MANVTRWIGIDLHRRRSQIAIIDEHGELSLSRRIVNDPDTFRELLGDPGIARVALEATYGWEWLAELLDEAGYDVHLAHPLRTRAIAAARVKTDAVDAKTLAHLLRTGLLPEAYIAPPELRDLRELLRHRAVLTRMRTSVKNRVHALLARQGILPEQTDLFGKAGRELLTTLELPDGPRQRLDSLMSLIDDFDREIAATTREIDQRAKADERVQVLCQIRGVGPYTAMLVIAEVGEVKRFPTARHLCAWAGLAPTVRSSDNKARLGHISRQGSPALRWALTKPRRRSPPAADRCAPNTSGSPNAAAPRSPESRSPARSSPSATTGSATARSAASPANPATSTTSRRSRHDQPVPDLRSPSGREVHARASSLLCLASSSATPSRTAVRLIEPPSTARHSGPPRATGWMTGATAQAATQSANRRPSTRAP
jgi:transposase